MRQFLLPALLATSLLSSVAAADNQIMQPYAPLRAVGFMVDTQQVLLYDEVAGSYVVSKVGETVDGWRVLVVDPEARKVIVAQKDGTRDELVLSHPPHHIVFGKDSVEPAAPPIAVVAAPAPIAVAPPPPPPTPGIAANDDDPYDAVPGSPDISLPPTVVVPVPVPEAAPAEPVRPAHGTDIRVEAGPPPMPSMPGRAPTRMTEERRALPRAEVDHQLNNFDAFLAGVQLRPAAGGGFIVLRLDHNSWIARMGLREGDTVRSIAGEQVSSPEDAARVYARLPSLNTFLVEVDRAGRRIVLRYDLR